MNVLFCEVCERKIAVGSAKEFHYTDDGSGAFCDVCWFFVKELKALEHRVADLEKEAGSLRRRIGVLDWKA